MSKNNIRTGTEKEQHIQDVLRGDSFKRLYHAPVRCNNKVKSMKPSNPTIFSRVEAFLGGVCVDIIPVIEGGRISHQISIIR